MPKRRKEPDEVIDPVLNGLEYINIQFPVPEDLPEEEEYPKLQDDAPGLDELDNPVLLIFGDNEQAANLGKLAAKCGFEIQKAILSEAGDGETNWADQTIILENFDNIVESCGIERNYFVCLMEDSPENCELLLSQCLASDAYYIGIDGDSDKLRLIFEELRKDGVPDAELAAIAAPMGLNIGAEDPWEKAVATVAEMLAAKAGKLKRLRQGHKKV